METVPELLLSVHCGTESELGERQSKVRLSWWTSDQHSQPS